MGDPQPLLVVEKCKHPWRWVLCNTLKCRRMLKSSFSMEGGERREFEGAHGGAWKIKFVYVQDV